MARNPKISAETLALRMAVDTYISNPSSTTFNYRQVSAAIGITDKTRMKAIAMRLAELAFDGELVEIMPGKYKVPSRTVTAEGTFVRLRNGKNSVILDDDEESIFVAERNSKHALNGDRVVVSIAAHVRGREPEAVVLDIVERKEQTFIGTLRIDKSVATLVPDSKFLATDIIIPRTKLKGGKSGDKAVVKITDWRDGSPTPRGEVVDILGPAGDNNAEIHAILAEFGLPYSYPAAIEKAAAKIDAGIIPQEVARREDMRGITTFTIDPRDAKDFDDALSVRKLHNGNWEIGVHIADVTHYVKPDTAIDREAESRATSVYLVDRVVPMLPEHLSNGICSLRPNEDKLAFSVIFEMTDNGKVVGERIVRAVINSDRRFTYEEAQEIIETGRGDLADEILTLDRLAKILRKQRYETGSVDFDRDEVRFEIDENGRPVSVYFKESKDSNKLIEEFMLLANRAVATFIGKASGLRKPKAFVYRIHDMPDPAKLESLASIARNFGYRIRTAGTPREVNKSINRMLDDIKGKPEENFLSTLAIRSMAKAVYTTTNIGHYGLGFDYYTHFTSPIRRFPDMMVHRLLERYLAGGRTVKQEKLEDQCQHSSEREQLAANAERASIKFKQVEYMAERLGQVYDGTITGVTEWGLYVELDENKCEGLVPVRDLADDFYDYDEANYSLVGRRRGNRYRLGDSVKVQVARADVERRMLDFVIVDEKNPPRRLKDLASSPFSKPANKRKSAKGASKTSSKKKTSKKDRKQKSRKKR